jgi:hypothetical protein
MNIRKRLIILLSLLLPVLGQAQLGGQRAFEFLNIPGNARLAALGGVNITSGWQDAAMVSANPALLNAGWDKQLIINRLGYFADIGQTSVTYARQLKSGVWAVNLAYLDYGDIQSFDNEGFLNGEFSIAEYAFSLSHSRAFGPFQAGASLKLAVSDIAAFNASALLLDLGGTFKHPEKDLTVGLAVKNLGFLLSDYTEGNDSLLPLDIQLGLSYKPEFMPFRFSVTARNLNRQNAVFFDPAGNSLVGQDEEPGFSEEVFRRLVFGSELIFSPNFQVRFAYNHLLRQELRLENVSGGAGFSFGFMMKIKRFEFSYSRALYHTAGGSNTLQLGIDTSGLIKKKN